jgi:DNA polymerase I-like protein with 3'-5' exonuclease and polymerase domains
MGYRAVTTVSELREMVEIVQSHGAFAFDVETRGNLERHPDLLEMAELEWKSHLAKLKAPTPEVSRKAREAIEARYRGELALDPLRNEVFWLAIATHGHSWAIPMGHPLGVELTPEEIGDGTTVPPPGYRKVLKNGEESLARARYHIPAVYADPPKQLDRATVLEELRPLFFSDMVKVGHNVKFDARSIGKYYGELPPGPFYDTILMQHILDENLMSYSLEHVVINNFKMSSHGREGKLGKTITTVPFDMATRYVHLDARWTWMLYTRMWRIISNREDLLSAFTLDTDSLRVLMEMEDEGILVDSRALKKLGKELDKRIMDLVFAISEHSFIGFNPDSNPHKQALLFNKKREGGLGLKPVKKTAKGAPSVDEESLQKLKHQHPVIELLIEYAEVKKLKSTYVEGLIPKLNDSRLHPSFHLHRTATGRLSSSNPNLQNIPRDSSIRSLFVAPDGYQLLVADYDQIELRVMAMFSQDKQMKRIFVNNEDIHSGAAALLYKKSLADVTAEERQVGKGVNFLTAYGGGAGKLSATTGISMDEARAMIDNYYKQFSGITEWKKAVIQRGRTKGYVSTMSGRRRRLPELSSNDDELRSRAERQAVNAVVQGSAADICKQAMVDISALLRGTGAKLLVQVHDELVVAVPEDLVEDIQPKFMEAMGHGRLVEGVPLLVSCHTAYSWAEAKGK